MNIADIRAQIETDLTWRRDEIRLLANQLSYITSEEDKERFRRSLVVMLYAHFEGFCKMALSIYATAINEENLLCRDVTSCIAAASLADTFKEYENVTKKSEIFILALPDDTKLHRYARQVELISELSTVMAQPVALPIDEIVDTESNLKPVMMRKILYRLGFQHDTFAIYEGDINKLLNYRNKVAHGGSRNGFGENDYRNLQASAYAVMDALVLMIMNALQNEIYKKPLLATTS